ncbi:hypothetical protein CBM2634_B170382 [Cupriavidus taiwanensis]|uniref:Uncharacterized protein n=1 Tax=Cupriavidus taiwanensis TaxID=164546 RepID=A0A375J799_9BURK|nr:hypothetical protein CBM2634_B170382 [Cupriavidus taiwanensis]
MLAFGVGACHSGARLRGNFRQLCQTDTGNDRACPGLDWHYAVWTRPADQIPQSGPCPPVPARPVVRATHEARRRISADPVPVGVAVAEGSARRVALSSH